MSHLIMAPATAVADWEQPPQPDISHLVTEDHTPVDNLFSEKQMRLLTEPLHSSWKPGRPFVATANVGLFFSRHAPAIVPDMMLSLDVTIPNDLWPKENRSYFIWEYGKAPDIVIEIVSPTPGGEATVKRDRYAAIGIPWYVIYDPVKEIMDDVVSVYGLARGVYEQMPLPVFESAGLQLVEWQGTYEGVHDIWLRWALLNGTLVPTGAEQGTRAEKESSRAQKEFARAQKESIRAEKESARALKAMTRAEKATARAQKEFLRAEQEAARAQAASARAHRLAERLRALGLDPDAL
jgi:Uma2 family endonuclease